MLQVKSNSSGVNGFILGSFPNPNLDPDLNLNLDLDLNLDLNLFLNTCSEYDD